jgi:PAS domain S-box-containing protein
MGGDEEPLDRRALDAIDDVFYVYDAQGRLVYWNRALNEVFDRSDAELDGMTAPSFFLPADREKVERAVERVFEAGSAVVEARADSADGTILFELTGRLITDAEGQGVGFAGTGRDVTESREREWRLERQNERLTEFSEVLTHDLRNPLQVAISYLELERAAADSEELANVAAALDRLQQIIDDVLLVAREGQTVIEREPVDLARVARGAWAQVETGAATLVVETTREVAGDAERLGRLFENVYRNAVDHGSTGNRNSGGSGDAVEHGSGDGQRAAGAEDPGDEGARGVTVTVRDTERGFVVEDDGVGFPAGDRERLFDPGVSE